MMLKQLLVFLAIYVACSIAENGDSIQSSQIRKDLTKLGMEKKYVDEFVAMDEESDKEYAALAKDPVGLKKAQAGYREKVGAFMNKLPMKQYILLNDLLKIYPSKSN